jgi:hypothetical protein
MKAKELIKIIEDSLKEWNVEDAEIEVQACYEMGLCDYPIKILDVGALKTNNGRLILCIGFDGYVVLQANAMRTSGIWFVFNPDETLPIEFPTQELAERYLKEHIDDFCDGDEWVDDVEFLKLGKIFKYVKLCKKYTESEDGEERKEYYDAVILDHT